MRLFFYVCFTSVILFGCSKSEDLNEENVNYQIRSKASVPGLPPLVQDLSGYGTITESPAGYTPSKSYDYERFFLLEQDNSEENVEIYIFNEGEIPAEYGLSCNLLWVQGDYYVYCEEGGSNCEEGTINGHPILIKCDDEQ